MAERPAWAAPLLKAKKDFTVQQLGALAAIVSGQEWGARQRADIGILVGPHCRACGRGDDTPVHRRF
eukprot:5203848-Lingulodinium_polyedra.AAC.1